MSWNRLVLCLEFLLVTRSEEEEVWIDVVSVDGLEKLWIRWFARCGLRCVLDQILRGARARVKKLATRGHDGGQSALGTNFQVFELEIFSLH